MQIDNSYDDKILACLTKDYKNTDLLLSAGINEKHFDTLVKQNYAKLCIQFYKKYHSVFTDHSFISYIYDLVKKKKIPDVDKDTYIELYIKYSKVDLRDANYFVDQVINYIKAQEYKQLVEDMATKYLPKNDFDSIESKFEQIKAKGVQHNYDVVDYYETLDDRLKRREEGVIMGISTGIPQLDEVLYYKGWGKQELYIIMAPTKMGKTNALLYFTQQASLQGYNVLYFSCEVSAKILSDRLDTAFADIYFDDLNFSNDIVKQKINEIRQQDIGKIFFSYHPTKSLTVTKAKHILEKVEYENSLGIDMVIFDYGDIMQPEVTSEKRIQIGDIFERMRGLGGEKDIPILSATQLNRDGAKKNVTQSTDVSEDFSKIMTADAVIGLNASDQEFAQGKIRISIVANRNGAKKTFVIKSNYAKMKFFERFEEYESF